MPQTVLVTGTSTGLGRRTAEVLAERGHTVAATMRAPQGKDRDAARTLITTGGASPGRILVVPMDIRDDESVNAGVAAAVEQAGGLDAVVNNAAYGITGIGESVTSGQLTDVLDTNLVGQQRVTRAALPHLRQRRSGLLVFVTSAAGRVTVPCMGAYSASKFGLEGLAQAYRYELRPLGIDVSIVEPGGFATNITASQVTGADESRLPDYAEVLELIDPFLRKIGEVLADPEPPDPREVADAIADLLDTPGGQRPERVTVDRFMIGRAVAAINESTKAPTEALLRELCFGTLLT
jgi:NAD(P)-dependent dehydrogenase (short-subunit alcohol dehydrogenase family)